MQKIIWPCIFNIDCNELNSIILLGWTGEEILSVIRRNIKLKNLYKTKNSRSVFNWQNSIEEENWVNNR